MKKQFKKFLLGPFNLEIWAQRKLVFSSKEEGIKGILKFIKKNEKTTKNLTPLRNKFLTGLVIFDKKVGNAVALLCVYLNVREVYGVIGSQSAEKTLKENKIKFYFLKTIPHILNKAGTDVCPLEKSSFSKTPKAFLNSSKNKSCF